MANLDGTNFAYHYTAHLAYVTTFDLPHAHNFHLRYPHVSCGCCGSNSHNMI